MLNLFRIEEDGMRLDLPYQYLKAYLYTLKKNSLFWIHLMLSYRWNTISFNWFLQEKKWTQNVPYSFSKTIALFKISLSWLTPYEPRRQKTGLRGFRPGPTQTGLYSHRRWLETWNFGFGKQRNCTIKVVKTKALNSFAVTAKLICVFVFAYAKIRFSHVAAHI